jgi:hypothetical protein
VETEEMTICIDYDQTYARNPAMWDQLLHAAEIAQVEVICISRRDDTPENRQTIRASFGDEFQILSALILCGPNTQKADAAKAAGFAVDIWIDDSPEVVPSSGPNRAALLRAEQAVARLDSALKGATS